MFDYISGSTIRNAASTALALKKAGLFSLY